MYAFRRKARKRDSQFPMALSSMSSIVRLARQLTLNDDDDDPLTVGVKEDALFLANTCEMIEAVLDDAGEMEVRNKSVKLWLCDLKYLAADAEDILEEYEYHLEQEEEEAAAAASSSAASPPGRDGMEDADGKEKYIRETGLNLLSKMIQIIRKRFKRNGSSEMKGIDEKQKHIQATFLNQLSKKIQKVRKRFDDINVRREAFKLRKYDGERRPKTSIRVPTTHLPNEVIYGRNDDKKRLIDLLKNNSLMEIVIGLVGVGGIGKTSLAQTIYNHQDINNYFNRKAWVTMSETFDVVQITKNVLECFTREAFNLTQLSVIQEELANQLQGKKFFLVLDDVWEEETLKSLRFLQQMGLAGSKILITTRMTRVVKAMHPSITFELKPLSKQDSWELFCSHAFGGMSENNVALDLVGIGKEIVEKCKGSPLLLNVLGDDLREVNSNRKRWMEILKHETWEIKDNSGNNKVMEILKLSYDHLPRRLKQCFLYCSVFPKDYVFEEDELFQIWAAHGLIETEGSGHVKDMGEECVKGLLQRSFIQSLGYRYSWVTSRSTMRFCLHDIMHDLAQYIIDSEQCLTKDCANTLELHHTLMVETSQPLRCYRQPIVGRTFFGYYNLFKQASLIDMLAKHLKHLRVLILKGSSLKLVHVSDSIGAMKHLRYLYLEDIYFLPDSVCSLHNLQTLVCPKVKELPREIKRLKRLQHLIIDNVRFPPGINELVKLQTLKHFSVIKGLPGEWAHPSELNDLRCLGGELRISNLNHLDGFEEARLLGLSSKHNLQHLFLEWDFVEFIEDEYCQRSALVLDALVPHNNLKDLAIKYYVGARFPKWLGRCSFIMLTRVYLSQCYKCVALPALGELPSLMSLCIEIMPCLKRIGEEFYGRSPLSSFLSLEHLRLCYLSDLTEWWGIDKCPFPRLSKLILEGCPSLRFSISDMDVEHHQPNLNPMFHTVSMMGVFNCPHVKEWCEAHASTTLAKVKILNLFPK